MSISRDDLYKAVNKGLQPVKKNLDTIVTKTKEINDQLDNIEDRVKKLQKQLTNIEKAVEEKPKAKE